MFEYGQTLHNMNDDYIKFTTYLKCSNDVFTTYLKCSNDAF